MAYPNAYCVKCGSHTDTQGKHTVLLQNNSRALRGECPKCAFEVYKILPKGRDYQSVSKGSKDSNSFPTEAKVSERAGGAIPAGSSRLSLVKVPSAASGQTGKSYPNAFCVRCQTHTETVRPHTVILENHSRAVTGHCKQCGSEVYRILGPAAKASTKPILAGEKGLKLRRAERELSQGRRGGELKGSTLSTAVLAAGLIIGIVGAILVYTWF